MTRVEKTTKEHCEREREKKMWVRKIFCIVKIKRAHICCLKDAVWRKRPFFIIPDSIKQVLQKFQQHLFPKIFLRLAFPHFTTFFQIRRSEEQLRTASVLWWCLLGEKGVINIPLLPYPLSNIFFCRSGGIHQHLGCQKIDMHETIAFSAFVKLQN